MTPTDLEALRERVRVKPLEWPDTPRRGQRVESKGGLSCYTIAFYGGDVGDPVYRWARSQGAWSAAFTSFEAAKDSAGADYEARILSALIAQKVEG